MGIFHIGALFRDPSVHFTIILAKNIFRNLGLFIVGRRAEYHFTLLTEQFNFNKSPSCIKFLI